MQEKADISGMPSGKTMSVTELRNILGVKKTDSYWIVHQHYFESKLVNGRIRIDRESFEKWYAKQTKRKKVNGEAPGQALSTRYYSAKDMARLLSISEDRVYAIWKRENFKFRIMDGKRYLSKSVFEAWYCSQEKFLLEGDRDAIQKELEESVSMPEMARMFGITRSTVYRLLVSKKYRDVLKTVHVAGQKRILKESIEQILLVQDTYQRKDAAKSCKALPDRCCKRSAKPGSFKKSR